MAMAKINFLNNIQDEDYKIVKESLEMDDRKTYHDCLVEIRRKSINVENERKRNNHQRRGNNSNSSNNSNRNSRANNLKKKMGDHYVDPNKWKKMSKQERDAHVKKAREARRGKSNDSTQPNTTSNNQPASTGLPTQYSSQINNTMTTQERELYEHMAQGNSTIIPNSTHLNNVNTNSDDISPHQRQFLNMVRSMNTMRHANVTRTTRKIVMCRNLQRSTPPIIVDDLLEAEWLEDDRMKYADIIEKSGVLTCDKITESVNQQKIPPLKPILPIFSLAQSNKIQCAPMKSNTLPLLDSWKQGDMDHLMQGFGKKMKKKFDKVMSYVDSSRKFRSKIFKDHVPLSKSMNLKQMRWMNQVANLPQVDDTRGQMLVDGGCDTCLVGKGFMVESTSERTVNVQGFQETMQIEALPIVTAVTAVDLEKETIIMEFNETIYVENNVTSLLSTYQTRENGVIVNDVARRHGGFQNLLLNDLEVPLSVMNGLLLFDIRKPTEYERLNCTRIIMTGDAIWNTEDYTDNSRHVAYNFNTSDVFKDVRPQSKCHLFKLHHEAMHTQSKINPTDVKKVQAKLGWIPYKVAEDTLKVTTQLAKNHVRLPLRHHFKSRFPQLNKNRLRETYSTDTIFSSVPAINTNETCMQIFCGKVSKFSRGYGMKSENQGVQALEDFVTEVGAPYRMLNDNAKMEISSAWKQVLRKYNIERCTTEPYHPHQNPVERRIQDIKKVALSILDHTGAPESLWLRATKYAILLLNHTATKSIGGMTPIEKAFGVTPDISALLQYSFYEPVYYLNDITTHASFPNTKESLGRFVGIAESTGDAMTYYVLTTDNKIIARSVMRSALTTENANLRISGANNVEELNNGIFTNQNIHYQWDDEQYEDAKIRMHNENDILKSTQDITGPKILPTVDPHSLIGFNFVLKNKNGVEEKATVIDWNKEGKFIIEFLNGGQELLLYNDLINYYERSKEENADFYIFKQIADHKFEKGKWFLKIIWENDEQTWETFTSIKQTDPITLSKYAHEKNMINTPGWKWCKRYSKNPKKFINISKLFANKRLNKGKKYKFGVEIPRNLKHALELDRINQNNLWGEATEKEVNEILEHATFIVVDDIKKIPKDYLYIPLQFVYDNKFDGRRKGRLVGCGNFTDPDITEIYSGVVGIEKVRILFLIADANGLIVIAADVCNAYLNGFTKEKLYSQIDYGKLKGKWLIISKALYGLKTSAARWADAIAEILRQIGFLPSYADTEIWMRDKGNYYEYIAVYVDDLIIAAKNPMEIIKELEVAGKYKFKGVGVPEYYLGGDVARRKNGNETYTTVLTAKTYIKNIVDKIERLFEITLKSYHSPLEGGYHPELDNTPLLEEEEISKYRMLTGSLNWSVTIGRIDVMFAAVTMSRYNHLPREGHMKVMFRIFGYLKYHPKASLKMDPSYPEEPIEGIVKANWKHLYPGAHEKLPHNAPVPKGKPIRVWGEFDADNAHDLENRRSVSGVLIYMNNSVVKWYSKRQNTVETSTYGSEVVSCRTAVELLFEMRYCVRMLGVPLLHESWLYGDNQAVIQNCSRPESVNKQ